MFDIVFNNIANWVTIIMFIHTTGARNHFIGSKIEIRVGILSVWMMNSIIPTIPISVYNIIYFDIGAVYYN